MLSIGILGFIKTVSSDNKHLTSNLSKVEFFLWYWWANDNWKENNKETKKAMWKIWTRVLVVYSAFTFAGLSGSE